MRNAIINALKSKDSALFTDPEINRKAFIRRAEVQMHLPLQTGHYTDSFCSLIHAQNVRPSPNHAGD